MESDKQYLARRVSVDEATGCWLWTGSTNDRYGTLSRGGHRYAHRFAYATYNGPIPAGMNVLHDCDTPLCCNPVHLFAGTQKDNIDDAHIKGRLAPPAPRYGEGHPNSKLTAKEVTDIRARVSAGEFKTVVAKDHRISDVWVGRICRGEVWA